MLALAFFICPVIALFQELGEFLERGKEGDGVAWR